MIQMLNLKKQFEGIRAEVLASITEVLESTNYVLGPKVRQFEADVAAYTGTKFGIGVANGTDALHLAVRALGLKEGDEVITTPFTFFATVESILYVGAKPVFVDIEPETYNMDPAKIEARITPRTRAIIPVHIFGHPAEMGAIMALAKKHNLKVIEDCAQSFGAKIGDKKTGSFGDAGCFSFYPSKNLGACGDAGLITLSDPALGDLIKKLRNHGSAGAYMHELVGINSRLDEVQAAILLIKMKHIDEYNDRRRKTAALYSGALKGKFKVPVELPGNTHVYHQYTIQHPDRDKIKEKLAAAEISSMVYYPMPMHLLPATKELGGKPGDLPVAERACKEVLSLPICPELAASDVERIAATVLASV